LASLEQHLRSITHEIFRAIEQADFLLLFFSENSSSKDGALQIEIVNTLDVYQATKREALRYAELILVRLENVTIPVSLMRFPSVDYFIPDGSDRLINAILTVGKK